jgi:hypothetical protein
MSESIDLQWLACELDHDIKNHAEGLERIRWNNRAMMLMLQKVRRLEVLLEERRCNDLLHTQHES